MKRDKKLEVIDYFDDINIINPNIQRNPNVKIGQFSLERWTK